MLGAASCGAGSLLGTLGSRGGWRWGDHNGRRRSLVVVLFVEKEHESLIEEVKLLVKNQGQFFWWTLGHFACVCIYIYYIIIYIMYNYILCIYIMIVVLFGKFRDRHLDTLPVGRIN